MKPSKRIAWTALLGGIVLLVAGCGDTFMASFKDGVYGYVSGSFSSAQVADLTSQFADYLAGLFGPANP